MLKPKKLPFLSWQQDSVQASSREPWLGVCGTSSLSFPLWLPKNSSGACRGVSTAHELYLPSLILPSHFALQIFGPRSPGEVPCPCSSRHHKGKTEGTWNVPRRMDWALPSQCLVFPSLSGILWFKAVEMMLYSRLFELINVHDLLIFWEPTTWCSFFKRLEYFVLKKGGKNTFH